MIQDPEFRKVRPASLSCLQEQAERRRQEHNRQLLEKMVSGEPLRAFDSQASWFPPRPVIKKDPKAIEKLYGSAVSVGGQNKPRLQIAQTNEKVTEIGRESREHTRRQEPAPSPD
jgi:hypothetical protein